MNDFTDPQLGDPERAAERARDYQRRKNSEHEDRAPARVRPLQVLSSADFVRDFIPPDYVLDGILQRGYLYSLTAPTGAGKTAIGLRLMASVALGRSFAGHDVERGRVLMLVGENADDVRARWIALSEQMGFDANEIDVHFITGVFSVADAMPQIMEDVYAQGDLILVIVDTSAAYFQGEDENDNKELGDHARVLRGLTTLNGNPCVVANCHPTKNATADSLLPRGGGAFIAEVDGNLTCWKTDRVVELHWQGKIRGPDFEPIALELVTVTSTRLVDSRGRDMPTVIARPLSETEQQTREEATTREMVKLMGVMSDHPGASIATMAEHAGWTGQGGAPHKSKVHRHLSALKKQKLVTQELKTWTLTTAGEKAAKRAK